MDMFEAFYDQHLSLVRATVSRVLPIRDDVEEVVQDVFLKLWDLHAAGREMNGSFIATVARNCAIDRRRANRVREMESLDASAGVDEDGEPLTLADILQYPVEVQPWIVGHIHDAIAALPEAQRDVVIRFFYDSESAAEIADARGTSVATVYTQLKAAKSALREALTAALKGK